MPAFREARIIRHFNSKTQATPTVPLHGRAGLPPEPTHGVGLGGSLALPVPPSGPSVNPTTLIWPYGATRMRPALRLRRDVKRGGQVERGFAGDVG